VDESLTAIARAGADIVVSYYASTWARWWQRGAGDALAGAVQEGAAKAPPRADAAEGPHRERKIPVHA
jgi:hypothetical protein